MPRSSTMAPQAKSTSTAAIHIQARFSDWDGSAAGDVPDVGERTGVVATGGPEVAMTSPPSELPCRADDEGVRRDVAQPLPSVGGQRHDERDRVAEQPVDEPQERPKRRGGDARRP